MSLSKIESRRHVGLSWARPAAAALAAGLVLGGCSADVARFDFPSLGVNDKSGETGAISQPSRPLAQGGPGIAGETPREAPSGNAVYAPPRAVRGSQDVQVAALPAPSEPQQPPAVAPSRPAPPVSHRASAPSAPAAAPPVAAAAPEKGEEIEVKSGDTLYGLSRRHKVSLSELMAVNGLKSAALRPGQKLHLPTTASAGDGRPRKPLTRQATADREPATAPAAPAPEGWGGSYTVKAGDSLYQIARHHKIKTADLQKVNGITDPRKVRPGTVLKVPGEGAPSAGSLQVSAAPAAPAPAAPAPAAPAASRHEPPARSSEPAHGPAPTKPTVINGSANTRVAAATNTETATDATAPAAAAPVTGGTGKLRWPAKGKVIAGFGARTDGSHNDGINVAVPMGTEVHAAESGVIAYAGNELKGYGNLVLVRHDNGWVTAYAHAEQILVKRGDKVRRGQVIAKAGKTGTVDQPQVHFELRQGSKPVDPTPFMERL